MRMEEPNWYALELLDQSWRMMNQKAIHHRTRQAIVKRGLAEFEQRDGYIRGRLTPAGIEFRNDIYRERARRLNTKIWKGR